MRIGRRFVVLLVAAAPAVAWAAGGTTSPPEKVLGIGGLFFRATDPDKLARWYLDHLGIDRVPTDYGKQPWRTDAGVTVFAPFPHDTTYIGPPTHMWMINFRVRDLDKIVAQLRASGIKVDIDPQSYPNGRFGHLHDPEGNGIELWQPAK